MPKMLLRGSWNTLANNFDNKDVDNVMENSSTSDQNIMLAIEVEDDNGDSLSTTDNNDGEQRIIERLTLLEEETNILKAVFGCDTKTASKYDQSRRSSLNVLHGELSNTAVMKLSSETNNAAVSQTKSLFRQTKDSTIIRGQIKLPESTFSLLIVATPWSASTLLAFVTVCISLTCLVLTLIYSFTQGNEINPLGLPVDVSPIVRGAQFLGVLIGVLMEDEIPQGLELIAISVYGKFLHRNSAVYKRVLASSFLRLVIGYLYLTALFVTVAQSGDVLTCFFDVLALQFVESIDDVAYSLAQRGFYGSGIMKVCQKKHNLQTVNNDKGISSNSKAHHFARFIYYMNAVVLIAGLVVISVKQHHGGYRCKTLMVTFDEKVWDGAHVTVLDDDDDEPWHLVYSYFNGIYEEDGLFDGYPRYRERNKNEGYPFNVTVGAEFVYCRDINSWVFRHEHITSHEHRKASLLEENENACSWLARSEETHEYDLPSVGNWRVWTGKVERLEIDMSCNDCYHISDCNYHGQCLDKKCICLDDHYGDHCQFDWPCQTLKSKVGTGCGVLSLDGDLTQFRKMYNRPVYMQYDLSGLPSTSSDPDNTVAFLLGNNLNHETANWFEDHAASLLDNYTIFLLYSGSRWYGSIMPPSVMDKFHNIDFLSEYHAFWEHSYKKDNTFIISEITFDESPVGIEFYLGSRQVEHIDLDQGLFYCSSNSSCLSNGTTET